MLKIALVLYFVAGPIAVYLAGDSADRQVVRDLALTAFLTCLLWPVLLLIMWRGVHADGGEEFVEGKYPAEYDEPF